MAVANKMRAYMRQGSWIRKMFEEGARLKSIYGADKVYDFSLGNPDVPPPPSVEERLAELTRPGAGLSHAYMPNTGYPETRAALASYLSGEYGVGLEAQHIVITCGAAGALNIIFKALLDPGDEVLVPAPYFVEYRFYVENHGGSMRAVGTREDFTLDLEALERAIGLRTKVVLINSPNNPTGQVYDEASIKALGEILERRSRELGRAIYLVSDEPYRKIIYDGCVVPSIFEHYRNSAVATSYSKDLSLPGQRIGFAAVHPEAEDVAELLGAMVLANRILGFVNAPALMQRLIEGLQGVSVDADIYKRRRDLMVSVLRDAGYDVINPPGAFYLFPKSPLADDVAFVRLLQEQNILVVPGSGFGGPGHFRACYCVDERVIEGAREGFAKAMEASRQSA